MIKNILRQGASGQTVEEAIKIIRANCGIPNGKGTEDWEEIRKHPIDGYDYIHQINTFWNGCTVEQITAGVTLDAVSVEFPDGDI